MYLCSLAANQSSSYFGTPEEPVVRNTAVVMIAQKPDCSSFLLLVAALDPLLTQHQTVPAGYDFTYCQEWGLTINDEVVQRVVQDIRRKTYPSIGDQLDALYHAGIFPAEMAAKLAEVKARFPK